MGAVWLFAGRAKVIVSWRRIFSSLWNGKMLTKTTPFCRLGKRKFAQWRVRRLWARLHKQVFLHAQRALHVHFSFRSIFCSLLYSRFVGCGATRSMRRKTETFVGSPLVRSTRNMSEFPRVNFGTSKWEGRRFDSCSRVTRILFATFSEFLSWQCYFDLLRIKVVLLCRETHADNHVTRLFCCVGKLTLIITWRKGQICRMSWLLDRKGQTSLAKSYRG